MSGTLALIGGGEWDHGCTFDRALLDRSGTNTVVVLPTGSAYENPGKLVAQAVDWFAGLGATVIEGHVLTRTDAKAAENAELLRSARFVYLAGTSAMHLRSVLKDTPVLDALVAAWSDGGVLAGTNAGADVLCDPMVDSRGGAFTVGLGVVANMAVIPRSNMWSHDKVHRTVELAPKGLPLAAVPERTALIRDGDGPWTVAGEGEVSVYVDGRPGTLDDLPG
jgi:cyanophycinase